MKFSDAQERYQRLHDQHQRGEINAEQFEAAVNQIRPRDSLGRTWSLGVESGDWYVYEDGAWQAGQPPGEQSSGPDYGTTAVQSPKKNSCLGRGCLILVVLAVVSAVCLGSLWLLADTSGLNLLSQASDFLGVELNEWAPFPGGGGADNFNFQVPTPGPLAPTRPAPAARAVDLTPYSGGELGIDFSYPDGWAVEEDQGQVNIFDLDSATMLFVGAFPVEPGSTAAGISAEVAASLQADAQQGTFREIESVPWQVPTGDDAYLNAWEWTEGDGTYQWAFDLEIVIGEINYFFFLIGDDPGLAYKNAELIERIGATFRR